MKDKTITAERVCPKGHVRTSNNTTITGTGKEVCNVCRTNAKKYWKKIGRNPR